MAWYILVKLAKVRSNDNFDRKYVYETVPMAHI